MNRKVKGSRERGRMSDARKERLESVVKMYLTGKSVLDISKKLGVSTDLIYKDMQLARKIWRKRNDRAAEALVAEEIAKIDRIEQAAWDGWEKSQKDAVETSEDVTADNKKSTSKKTKGQAGAAQFLTVALECVNKRCKMLKIGDYATEESTKLGGLMVEVVVDSQEEIAEIMDFGDYKKLTAMTTPSDN
jgi:hypothetical protein